MEVQLETGHKVACKDIHVGEKVIKYGYPIGTAVREIKRGERVHTDNLKTGLSGVVEYQYNPGDLQRTVRADIPVFQGYLRENGEVGIRNEIWIIPTVGCVNHTAGMIAKETGAVCFSHPYGCSQMGEDQENTQKILKHLILHPNAGGVLVVGLGCENNNIEIFQKYMGSFDSERIRFLNCQDVNDEIAEGIAIVEKLKEKLSSARRVPVPLSKLKIGVKCGGSDGLSGITANPLTGKISDFITACGGTVIMTEVPEMFGAETILMNRCENSDIFAKTVRMINQYKEYFLKNGQTIYENPSPGNKAGGITTLEEKSLGCVQKGEDAIITDVLPYGERSRKEGLNLLYGPGNDGVAITNLAAAGAHLILFTTGRGTPLGAPVPTVKISSNKKIFRDKPHWIDFDASGMTERDCSGELLELILETANRKQTKNEKNNYREIAIWKNGVTL